MLARFLAHSTAGNGIVLIPEIAPKPTRQIKLKLAKTGHFNSEKYYGLLTRKDGLQSVVAIQVQITNKLIIVVSV